MSEVELLEQIVSLKKDVLRLEKENLALQKVIPSAMPPQVFVVVNVAREIQNFKATGIVHGENVFVRAEAAFALKAKAESYVKNLSSKYREMIFESECLCERSILVVNFS